MRKVLTALSTLLVGSILFSGPVSATQFLNENAGATWIDFRNNTQGVNYLIHNSGDGNNLEFAARSNGVTRWQLLSINRTGNIGIGTNNAQARLHVAGDAMFARPGGSSFYIQTPSSDVRMFAAGGKPILFPEGNVGIGVYSASHKLTVNGTIKAREVLVTNQNWADYVFEEGYDLMSLNEVENYINAKGHLPRIPSAEVIEREGIPVGDMQRMQMEKIEELTLYIIDLEKRIKELENR